MPRVIHARLLVELQRRSGWSDSPIVREGIKALNVLIVPKGKCKIVAVGRFRSGVADVGSNKRHLKGFGK